MTITMAAPLSAAEILIRATSRAGELRRSIFVVKLGGSAMEDPAVTRGTLQSIVALQSLGIRLVLVHGGGKPIDRAMAAAGLTPKKVAGRRYTDEATLEIVVQVLREINQGIRTQLEELGGRATSFTDADWFPLKGVPLVLQDASGVPVDLGRVGTVTDILLDDLENDVESGRIPVLPCLAMADDGGWLNVNADTVASAVSGALQADACYFLTDTPGVLRDVANPASLLPQLTRSECESLIADGVIAGGMIPKVEACFEALVAGAGRAVILDGRRPHALLGELISDTLSGTTITK